MAIKFFIQKDIPHDIQIEVCETIAVSLCSIVVRSILTKSSSTIARLLVVELSPKYLEPVSS